MDQPLFYLPGVPKKLYLILNLYKVTLRHAIWKYFHGTKNHHLETYLLNFEVISPLYPFFMKFEFTRQNKKLAEIEVKEIYRKVWFQPLKLPRIILFSSVFAL